MSTGYYNRVENTVVNGSQLQSYLTGDNIRVLEFDAALKMPPIKFINNESLSLSANEWIQASISSLVVSLTGATSSTGSIYLGTDSASQASSYIDFFDIKSTNDVRLLNFVIHNMPISGVLSLGSNSTSANVVVQRDSGNSAASQVLFNQASPVGSTASGADGSMRLVLVSSTNLTSGSQNITFNVLQGSL